MPSRVFSNLSARLHAFLHGLFRPSEETLTREVFDQLAALSESHGLSTEAGREVLIKNIADDVAERLSRKFDGVDVAPVT